MSHGPTQTNPRHGDDGGSGRQFSSGMFGSELDVILPRGLRE